MIGLLANPWLLAGLGALAVPILVHLAEREERGGRRFPSLMFLRRIPFPMRRRRVLRDRALLALRCLALALLVLAFAAPIVEPDAPVLGNADDSHDVVIAIDRSYSMSPEPRWRAALDIARERIGALAPGDRAALVAFDDRAVVVTPLTTDRGALTSALDALSPSSRATRFVAALEAASRVLAEGAAARRSLVFVSDLQRSGFDQAAYAVLGESIMLEVAALETPVEANAAVVDAYLDPTGPGGDALAVRLHNTGGSYLEGGRLEIAVDGHRIAMRDVSLVAGAERTESVPIAVPIDRAAMVEITLGADAIAADNTYRLTLAPRRAVAVLVVEPDRLRPDHAVYLEQALALARTPAMSVRRVSRDALSAGVLDDADVVVLDDVAIPNGADGAALEAFVEAGGGLFVVTGESFPEVSPAEAGRLLPAAVGPRRSGVRSRILTDAPGHPLWAGLGVAPRGPLGRVRVESARTLRPLRSSRTLARLDDDAPFIVERNVGAGRVMVLATAADSRWSDFAIEPVFVGFVQGAIGHLANRSQIAPTVAVGAVVDLARVAQAHPHAQGWRAYLEGGGAAVIETPGGGARRLAPGQRLLVAEMPGVYEAHRADGRPPTLPLAVNTPGAESVLAAFSPAAFESRISRGPVSAPGSVPRRADDRPVPGPVPVWLLVVAAVLLAGESMLARQVSIRRAGVAAERRAGVG